MLFRSAVIADTHMNQSEDYSSSPYPANALANARTRRVVAELNQLDLAFIVHLGDLVNPVPELPTYEAAANHFKNQVAALKAPLYLVPGNHDVGDKPVSWMPAGRVNDEHLALYESHFGRHYFAFDHGEFGFRYAHRCFSLLHACRQSCSLLPRARRRFFRARHFSLQAFCPQASIPLLGARDGERPSGLDGLTAIPG